ncbi:lysoplasmalogenase [bacterium]|nr:lysoplasmalogenase [bacterium]
MTPLFAIITGMLVGGLLAFEGRPGPARGWIKAAASTAFIATALSAGATDTAYGRWVLVALVFSWVGDVALVSTARHWFLVGLSAFLLGHVAYAIGFGARGADVAAALIAAAVLLVPAGVVLRWLWPHLPGQLRGPVVAYVVVITAMVAMAAGTVSANATPVILIAAIAFYVSDLLVARDRFAAPGMINRYWGLPLYYLAQVLFALSV